MKQSLTRPMNVLVEVDGGRQYRVAFYGTPAGHCLGVWRVRHHPRTDSILESALAPGSLTHTLIVRIARLKHELASAYDSGQRDGMSRVRNAVLGQDMGQ